MKFFPERTVFMTICPLTIRWYAVLILCGAFIAYYFARKNLKEYRNIDVDGFFDDVFLWLLWGGIVGARLWFCLFYNAEYYFSHPVDILKVWDGGLAFHGGFVGGLIAVLILCRKRNKPFIKVLDAIAPTVLIGQAIGRWGNFVNQECHGSEVSADYFNGLLSFLKDDMFINGAYYKPLFFYESMLCLLGFILINFILKKTRSRRGEMVGAYLIWYGIVRFFIEGDRTDSLLIGSLKTAQVTSIVFVLIGVLFYLGFYEKIFKRQKPTVIFDLDGTLQNSTPAIIESFKATFEKYGKVEDFTPDRQLEVLGPPIRDMFEKYFPDKDPDELCAYYREINHRLLAEHLDPMPNALETVAALKEEGCRLAIFTTRDDSSVYNCLKKCGFKDNDFDTVITLNAVKKTKPDPEGLFKAVDTNRLNSADVIYVGDSTADIQAGKAYGAYTVCYSVLEGKKALIEAEGPNRIISDLAELKDIVREEHYFTYDLK